MQQNKLQLITLRAGGISCAIPLSDIREITRSSKLNHIPSLPPGVEGVLDLRGETVFVMSLSHLMGYRDEAVPADRKIIIVTSQESEIGLMVDFVSNVVLLDKDKIGFIFTEPCEGDLIAGVFRFDGQLISLLNTSQLFKDFQIATGRRNP